MKAYPIIVLMGLSVACLSCKNLANKEVTILRDCTGTYLRYNSKDYQVCNKDKLEAYPDGEKLNVSFKMIDQCKNSSAEEIVCFMFHENQGWIEVQAVNGKQILFHP